MLVLGIDPGLQHTGWGIVSYENSNIVFVDGGVIDSDPKESMANRLNQIHTNLTKVVEHYKPYSIAIEEVFVNSNPRTSLKLGQARGMGFLVAAQNNTEIHEYSPKEIKKALVGTGNAEKEQVAYMVKMLLPSAKITTLDMADALAIAICHTHSLKNSLFVEKTMK